MVGKSHIDLIIRNQLVGFLERSLGRWFGNQPFRSKLRDIRRWARTAENQKTANKKPERAFIQRDIIGLIFISNLQFVGHMDIITE